MFVENLSGKNMNVEQKLVDFAVSIAKEAGELTFSLFNDVDLEIIKKSDGSPVTQADRGAESLLRKRISDSFPEDSIIGEEEENVVGSSGRTWILDPIDGTQSFINGVPLFANLVAFEDENGSAVGVINLPAIDECIWAGRGLGCFANGKKCMFQTLKLLMVVVSLQVVLIIGILYLFLNPYQNLKPLLGHGVMLMVMP